VTFFAGFVWQHDLTDGSRVDAAHAHIAARVQALNVVELRLQLVRGAEKILLAANDEHTGH